MWAFLFLLSAVSGLVWAVWRQEGRIRRLEESRTHTRERIAILEREALDMKAWRAFGPTPAPATGRKETPL